MVRAKYLVAAGTAGALLAAQSALAQITNDPLALLNDVESSYMTGATIGLSILGIALVVGAILAGIRLRKGGR
jgi:hypothetical protein